MREIFRGAFTLIESYGELHQMHLYHFVEVPLIVHEYPNQATTTLRLDQFPDCQ